MKPETLPENTEAARDYQAAVEVVPPADEAYSEQFLDRMFRLRDGEFNHPFQNPEISPMQTEIIPNGTRVKVKHNPNWWAVVRTAMSRSGKTRRYLLSGREARTVVDPETGDEKPGSVPVQIWYNSWQIVEVE